MEQPLCLNCLGEEIYFMFVSSILLLERNFDVAQICEVGHKHLLIVKRDDLVF